jgi:5-(carboxyamino)imidazole ribonucleotide mutase
LTAVQNPQVILLLGSKSDAEHRNAISQALDKFGITHVTRIASAHKVTSYLLDLMQSYEQDGLPHVYITVAGSSNALSGVVDANSRHPVLACPPYGDRWGGMDILSTVRMPGGVATLLVLEPGAAALAAAKILGVGSPEISQRVTELQERTRRQAIEDDQAAQDS